MVEKVGNNEIAGERVSYSEALTQRLVENIYSDPILCLELGTIVKAVIVLPMLERESISLEQFDRISVAENKTLTEGMTPEQIAEIDNELKRIHKHGDKPSPFSGFVGPY